MESHNQERDATGAERSLSPVHTPLDATVADGLADEILLDSAVETTVPDTGRRSSASWSPTPSTATRAWTKGGQVD